MLRVGRVLPVNVHAVEAVVANQLDARGGEALDPLRSGHGLIHGVVRVRVRPATYAEQDFEVSVGRFEELELLDAAVDVVSRLAP